MKAVTYSRFSTDRQTDSSIADQERVCTEHAARQGWQIAERYRDEGISGAAIGNRPSMLRLMEAAIARRFDVLLVMDLSRLSRSQGDLAKTIDRLTFVGVRIIGVQDGFDTARDGHELVSGLSGIIGQQFRKMVARKTYTALESRAKSQRPTGGKAYGYHDNAVDESQAAIVREIFQSYADGMSWRQIADGLNVRGVPSPGSSWNRSTRRAHGWQGSGVRVILRNERYRGVVNWNCSEWRKDPDSGKRQRVERPRSEWITHTDASLRIVSQDLWERVERRMAGTRLKDDPRLKSGGKPKYLLSGLLRCDTCGGHYTITAQQRYGCLSHHDGKACSNDSRVRKDEIEEVILRGPETGLAALLAPARIAIMAKEMQDYYVERLRAMETRTAELPRELQELGARIDRLRERLRKGDPDMPPDELQAAIDRAEAKRRELEAQQPEYRGGAKVLAMLPRAADLYRRQVLQGLDGDYRASLKVRVFLREWFGGKIILEPLQDGGLMAHWNQDLTALIRAAGTLGSCGSGGRI
jgi:site-specific DNA recombinase